MSNITITDNDVGAVELEDGEFRDAVINFGGEDTFAPGTIMARRSDNQKMVPFDPADVGGVNIEIPKGVLTREVAASGAGDVSARVLVAGKVRKERLIIDTDGDGSNVNEAVLDQLRDFGIVALDTTQLARADNS